MFSRSAHLKEHPKHKPVKLWFLQWNRFPFMWGGGNFNILKSHTGTTKNVKASRHLFLKIKKNVCSFIVIYFWVFPAGKISSWIYVAVTSNSEHFIKMCQIKLLVIIFNQVWISSRHIFIIIFISLFSQNYFLCFAHFPNSS